MQGLVLKSTGKWYNIALDDGQIIKATIRGKLRIEGLKTTNPIAVRIIAAKRIVEKFVVDFGVSILLMWKDIL